MLKINDAFPPFNLKAVVSSDLNNCFVNIDEKTHSNNWKVFFFWPKDFTFVCPTEMIEFGLLHQQFMERNTTILGVSTDSEYAHLAWKQQNKKIADLPYPMLADIKRELCTSLDILDANEGVAQRATYIVDPDNMIRFVMMTDLNVGRNPHEVLRILDALQTNQPTPCNWQKGDKTIITNQTN